MGRHHFITFGFMVALFLGCSETASKIASDIEQNASAAKTEKANTSRPKKDAKTTQNPTPPKPSSSAPIKPRSVEKGAAKATNPVLKKDTRLTPTSSTSEIGTTVKQCRSRCNRLKSGSRNECLRGCKDPIGDTTPASRSTPKITPVSPTLAKCRRVCNRLKDGQRNACMRRCK